MKDDARRKETNKGELGLKKELGLADAVSLEMGAMICGGLPNIDPSNLTPLFPKGIASVAVAARPSHGSFVTEDPRGNRLYRLYRPSDPDTYRFVSISPQDARCL